MSAMPTWPSCATRCSGVKPLYTHTHDDRSAGSSHSTHTHTHDDRSKVTHTHDGRSEVRVQRSLGLPFTHKQTSQAHREKHTHTHTHIKHTERHTHTHTHTHAHTHSHTHTKLTSLL